MSDEEEAIWKSHPDYPFLQANQFGEVRTIDRVATDRNGKKYHIKGRVLKQRRDRYGYMDVKFRVNGKEIRLGVHRIVATCFIPNPNNYPEVNHIDNDPTNNAVGNLEWCTHEYNMSYKEKFGVSAKEATKVLRKPVIVVDLNSYKVLWFESQHEAARQLDVDDSHITKVVKGYYNKTSGYWFCYADENAVEKVKAKFGDRIAEKVEKLISENKKVLKSC